MDVAPTMLDQFTDALERLEVDWTRTSTSDFQKALATAVIEPAVGAELPFDGARLAGSAVTLDPTPADLEAARTGVTAAWGGIAEYGSLIISYTRGDAALASLFPPLHVAVLRASDVAPNLPAALRCIGGRLREGPAQFVLATGPSATADMGALVRGAHGPEHVHVIILEDQ